MRKGSVNMGNEVKAVLNLTAAQERIKELEKQNKDMRERLLFAQKEMERMRKKIARYERSLLSAVTTLDWKEWEL